MACNLMPVLGPRGTAGKLGLFCPKVHLPQQCLTACVELVGIF